MKCYEAVMRGHEQEAIIAVADQLHAFVITGGCVASVDRMAARKIWRAYHQCECDQTVYTAIAQLDKCMSRIDRPL